MNTKYKTAIGFGLAHGFNDFIAGYLLAYLSIHSTNLQVVTLAFLGYSIIAFGGQLPAGVLLDKTKHLKTFSIIAIAGLLLAVGASYFNILVAIFFSSIASTFIHVCGGAACYLSDKNNAALSGIFTSPGVFGVISGGILGAMSYPIFYFYFLLIPLCILIIWIVQMKIPHYKSLDTTTDSTSSATIDVHDFFMLTLLAAIAFRSLLWNLLHIMCFNDKKWLLGLGISAALGKLLGGYITYKIPWKKYVFFSMIGTVLLLNINIKNLWLFCIAVALLQSAVPITLLLMQNYLKNQPATATGLSLGIAIVLAGIPTYIESFRQIQHNKFLFILICILFLLPNWWMVKKSKWNQADKY